MRARTEEEKKQAVTFSLNQGARENEYIERLRLTICEIARRDYLKIFIFGDFNFKRGLLIVLNGRLLTRLDLERFDEINNWLLYGI